MEDHPITFVILVLIGIIQLTYYTIKIVIILLVALCRWIGKKVEKSQKRKEVNNNVIE